MPTLNSLAKVVAKPLPRVISPRGQAILDYVLVGSFLGTATWFWRHNKRAALAALLCGGAKLAVTLLTDNPGGVRRVITPRARREIDLGLAAMVATMPEFFAFKDEPQKKFFLAQGALITIGSELTRYPERSSGRKERSRAA
ncbi:MAG TPA: hypothetical protein VFA67_15805 [Candidatus Sulfotelmatobacter sp.]|nr:hypothetical protein [Candidatus Sulfotelmatobacter sp.]